MKKQEKKKKRPLRRLKRRLKNLRVWCQVLQRAGLPLGAGLPPRGGGGGDGERGGGGGGQAERGNVRKRAKAGAASRRADGRRQPRSSRASMNLINGASLISS